MVKHLTPVNTNDNKRDDLLDCSFRKFVQVFWYLFISLLSNICIVSLCHQQIAFFKSWLNFVKVFAREKLIQNNGTV